MSESPRTWTLRPEPASEGWRWGTEPDSAVGATIDDLEGVEVVELHPVLDLLKHAYGRADDPYAHPLAADCDCVDCELDRKIEALLREHGRLGGQA